jgi:hypothetical protein
VWVHDPGDGDEVYVWERRAGTGRLTTDTYDDEHPDIEGGRIAWIAESDLGPRTDVRVHDLRDRETWTLAHGPTIKSGLIVDAATIVWTEEVSGAENSEIVVSDTGLGSRVITHNAFRDHSPRADGGLVVWEAAVPTAGDEIWLATKDHEFTDVPLQDPRGPAIGELADREVIDGYPDGTFRPGAPVWRQHFAKMIVLALVLPVSEADTCPFPDVEIGGPGGLYPDNYIAVAADEGLTRGTGAGLFSPYAEISRTQVITMVVRAIQSAAPDLLAQPPNGYTGTWGSFSATHQGNARLAEFNHLLDGLQLRTLDPWDSMSRGECAQILHNMVYALGILPPVHWGPGAG